VRLLGPKRNYTLGATQHGDRGWPSSAFGARPPNPASSITLGISNRDLAISAQSALLALITPRSTGRGIDPSTTRTERNAVTLCSGEDKLTREDSKSVALDPEAFVNATRGRGVLQSIGGRRLAHANHYH